MSGSACLQRRRLLATLVLGAPALAQANFAVDGPARLRNLAQKSILLDVARLGQRIVAVGERGHVLLSDDEGGTWRQARSVPTRATLTALHATDAQHAWAVGHGGVILGTGDGGETWRVVNGQVDGPDVLLAVRVERDGRGLAVGGFGAALRTPDGGKSWEAIRLLDGDAGDKHLNRIIVTASGAWLIAAEGGHVLRSADGGASWSDIRTPYVGSLWHGLQLPTGVLLVCGMRGNVVRSTDDGRTWTHLSIPDAGSLTGSALLADGRPVLVGVDGTIALGDREGVRFSLQRLDDRTTLTAVVDAAGRAVVVSTVAGMRTIAIG